MGRRSGWLDEANRVVLNSAASGKHEATDVFSVVYTPRMGWGGVKGRFVVLLGDVEDLSQQLLVFLLDKAPFHA
jgi:hypothetical protein